MHRLQISLSEWQYHFLREQASRTGQSIAGLIRKLIEQEAQTVQRPVEEDPIWEVVGIGRGGPPYDISERVDEFLRGAPKTGHHRRRPVSLRSVRHLREAR